MTFLPIIERELRVRARSRATYWSRFAVALTGALIGLPSLFSSGPFSSPAATGRSHVQQYGERRLPAQLRRAAF